MTPPCQSPLPDWHVIRVGGADAGEFLHGQFTGDLHQLTGTRAQLSAWCGANGRVLFCFHVLQIDADFLLIVPAGRGPALLARLKMFVLRAAVTLVDDTARWSLAGVVLADNAGQQARHTVVRDGSGWRLTVNHGSHWLCGGLAADALTRWIGAPLQPASPDAWSAALIRDGLPIASQASPDQFLPQSLNLDILEGVSFQKGCYPGQEVIARIKFRGQVRQRLQCFTMQASNAPPPDTPLYLRGDTSGNTAGVVLAGTPLAQDRYMLLAVASTAPQHSFAVGTPDGPTLAALPLPYSLS